MPLIATENRVMAALFAAFQTIGTPPSSWLSQSPQIIEGVPGDALPKANVPRVYLEHSRTDPTGPEAGVSSHYHRVQVVVWCVAKTPTDVNNLKADVLRALYANETSLAGLFGQPAWAGEFVHRRDLSDAGMAIGQQVVFVDVELAHNAP